MKILVVDDDPAMTDLLRLILEPTLAVVITANSANDGIQLAKTHKPDIILMDMMMPDMNGWQACRSIRTFSSVPIIILSALADPSMIANALDAGADDFLVKPISSGELFAHINKLVRRIQMEQNIRVEAFC